MTRYWLGIATLDHVRIGVEGGFCQLGHGKAAPIPRLSPGDWLAYYSRRTALDEAEPVQAFTALGQVASGEPTRSSSAKVSSRRDATSVIGSERVLP